VRTPDEAVAAVKRAIDAAGAGGGLPVQ
jgi:hypothetical protein